MDAFTVLLICLAAQILIAAWLGIYFLRRGLEKRRKKEGDGPKSSKN